MERKKAVIIVDSREDRNVVRYLKTHDADIIEKQLHSGDYICSERVCVERKRIDDFLQSIVDQRIFRQVERMCSDFERPVIIIEGNPELLFINRDIHKNSIRGVLASIAIDYKVPIIWTQNSEETAAQIFWIAHREQVLDKREIQVRGSKKASSLKEQQEFLVSGLPGINSKRARKLLEHFKSPEKIFMAKEESLLKIDGFGDKTVKKMKGILTGTYQDK